MLRIKNLSLSYPQSDGSTLDVLKNVSFNVEICQSDNQSDISFRKLQNDFSQLYQSCPPGYSKYWNPYPCRVR